MTKAKIAMKNSPYSVSSVIEVMRKQGFKISRQALTYKLNGDKPWTIPQASAFAKAIGVDPRTIFFDEYENYVKGL